MEAASYFDLLPEEIWQRINRIVRADPTFAMIMDLPYEVRMHVAVQMPYPDVLRFCATSTEAKRVCDNDFFWKWKIAYDFPESPAEGHEGRWRELYKTYWKEAEEKLLLCAIKGHLECVESKLQLGIDPNSQDEGGQTALSLASYWGRVDIVRMLLDHGANPNLQNVDSQTALDLAYRRGHVDTVELLLEHGARRGSLFFLMERLEGSSLSENISLFS